MEIKARRNESQADRKENQARRNKDQIGFLP
jgi:hypothetical protein